MSKDNSKSPFPAKILAPVTFIPSGTPLAALSKNTEYGCDAPVSFTTSAGLAVMVELLAPGSAVVTSNASSRLPLLSILNERMRLPSGTPLSEPWKNSMLLKKPVAGLNAATSRGETVTVPPLPLVGTAVVTLNVSRTWVELIGR